MATHVPEHLTYTKDHEWIQIDGQKGIVGITDYAQAQLGDVVFVDLPAVGRKLKRGEAFGVVESVKTVSDLFSPVDGTVLEVNKVLVDQPDTVNRDPYGGAWMIKISIDGSAAADLLTASAYTEFTKSL